MNEFICMKRAFSAVSSRSSEFEGGLCARDPTVLVLVTRRHGPGVTRDTSEERHRGRSEKTVPGLEEECQGEGNAQQCKTQQKGYSDQH